MKRSPSVNKKTMPEGMAKRFDPEGETGDESNRRERVARMSGGRFGLAIGAAQVGPIDVGAQVFAADGTIRFALNVDSQLFATGAAIGHVAQMPDRCIAAVSKQLPISHVQREKIFFEIHSDMVFTV